MVILRIIKENFKAVIKKFLKSEYYVQSSYFQVHILRSVQFTSNGVYLEIVHLLLNYHSKNSLSFEVFGIRNPF